MKLINISKIGAIGICVLSINALATHPAVSPSQTTRSDSSAHPLKDTEITAKVKEEFIQQKLFDKANISPLAIHVKTINGTVFLTGKVPTRDQVNNAITIAKGINGVKEVKSELEIEAKK